MDHPRTPKWLIAIVIVFVPFPKVVPLPTGRNLWLINGGLNNWVVLSNIFHVQPYLGKIPILTNIFQMG